MQSVLKEYSYHEADNIDFLSLSRLLYEHNQGWGIIQLEGAVRYYSPR